MLWLRQFSRFCSSTSPSSKELLLKLRKKTGFSYINCKKALDSCNRDLEKAEKWLAEKAKELGWQKAAKLADRKTTQGLIGVYAKDNLGTFVEVSPCCC
ncbi:unnamed protein product [Soboliphyme baturini]|uniref:Elongation factor Ts, mitochondrial n=1 Tax=Soboliphyme baturini TaxID=241478 RepID=A0A183ITU7_9BILA|nr:unnamed protein product [Soboliphyme baturini]